MNTVLMIVAIFIFDVLAGMVIVRMLSVMTQNDHPFKNWREKTAAVILALPSAIFYVFLALSLLIYYWIFPNSPHPPELDKHIIGKRPSHPD